MGEENREQWGKGKKDSRNDRMNGRSTIEREKRERWERGSFSYPFLPSETLPGAAVAAECTLPSRISSGATLWALDNLFSASSNGCRCHKPCLRSEIVLGCNMHSSDSEQEEKSPDDIKQQNNLAENEIPSAAAAHNMYMVILLFYCTN
jgi:hypothetical protein